MFYGLSILNGVFFNNFDNPSSLSLLRHALFNVDKGLQTPCT